MNKPVFLFIASAMVAATPEAGLAAEKTAIFAGGCFWCVEKDFEHVAGVVDAVSGYTGGTLKSPTYRNHPGHVEAVRITYDDAKTSYAQLLHVFWRSVDPTDPGGQFCDRGHSYTTAIFAGSEEERVLAEKSKSDLQASGKLGADIVTPVLMATFFTPAEDYHQDYYKKNPVRYSYYRRGCGRDARIEALWGAEAHAGIAKSDS